MLSSNKCFRCGGPLGDRPQGIMLVYRGESGEVLNTLPKMHCAECMKSFFTWAHDGYNTRRGL